MKIIFSRKGFDSASGGAPSPIINGKPTSIPIPTQARSETTYKDLGLGDIVARITRGRVTAESCCHHDPMFERGRCAFGQTGTAQSHLANNGVGIDDVFLFFGLFAQCDGSDRHHRIFGYLKVEEVTNLGPSPKRSTQPQGFCRPHPHTIGSWNPNNTIYMGPGNIASSDADCLRLSVQDGLVSHWVIPSWLHEPNLTYHHNPKRWATKGILKTVARGQEFVTDVTGCAGTKGWLQRILNAIDA